MTRMKLREAPHYGDQPPTAPLNMAYVPPDCHRESLTVTGKVRAGHELSVAL